MKLCGKIPWAQRIKIKGPGPRAGSAVVKSRASQGTEANKCIVHDANFAYYQSWESSSFSGLVEVFLVEHPRNFDSLVHQNGASDQILSLKLSQASGNL